MIRNLPGQHIGFDFIDPDGLPVTVGSPVVYVTKDNGNQTAGGGTTTHKGQGSWSYALTQADTDAAHIAIKPVLAGAFAASINVFPSKPVIIVSPISSNQEQRTIQNIRTIYWKEIRTHNINVRTENGALPVDLSGIALRAVIQTNSNPPENIESLNVTVSGSNNNIVEFTTTQLTSNRVGETLIWALRDSVAPYTVFLEGQIVVLRAAYISP